MTIDRSVRIAPWATDFEATSLVHGRTTLTVRWHHLKTIFGSVTEGCHAKPYTELRDRIGVLDDYESLPCQPSSEEVKPP